MKSLNLSVQHSSIFVWQWHFGSPEDI